MAQKANDPDLKCVVCSIFKRELEKLRDKEALHLSFTYLNSILHLSPGKLEKAISSILDQSGQNKTILVYGNCCASMNDFTSSSEVIRTTGENCCEILLGEDEYKKLVKDRAFFVMPEWVHRWKEVFIERMGLHEDLAQEIMSESNRYLLYLDTGISPIPEKELNEMSAFFKLPWKVRTVDIEGFLLKKIREASTKVGDSV